MHYINVLMGKIAIFFVSLHKFFVSIFTFRIYVRNNFLLSTASMARPVVRPPVRRPIACQTSERICRVDDCPEFLAAQVGAGRSRFSDARRSSYRDPRQQGEACRDLFLCAGFGQIHASEGDQGTVRSLHVRGYRPTAFPGGDEEGSHIFMDGREWNRDRRDELVRGRQTLLAAARPDAKSGKSEKIKKKDFEINPLFSSV